MKFCLVSLIIFSYALAAKNVLKINHGRPTPRVVGGEDAAEGQFPHQVSLQWGISDYHQHSCGASIISPTWIATAAHCKTNHGDVGNFTVKAGILDITDVGQTRNVVEIIVHPEYVGDISPNDIALMRVDKAFEFNDKIKPISLPVAGVIPNGDSVLSGWGSISDNVLPSLPVRLQTAVLPLLTIDECAEALIALEGSAELLADTNICTGPLSGSQGVCSGDFGGPLIQDNVLIGIASWGFFPCGSSGAPSVFTRTSAFNGFIVQHVTDL